MRIEKRADELKGRLTFLVSADDLQWLFETHCRRDFAEQMLGAPVESAAIVGNEDSPESVWVSADSPPMVDSIFVRIL